MQDKLKLAVAALLVVGGIAGFYYFSEYALFLRVLGLLLVAGVAVAVALQTDVGRRAQEFSQGAMVEMRKVVWPSRKETGQTTLIVMAMVVAVGVLLWLFDMFLLWAVKLLTGQGS